MTSLDEDSLRAGRSLVAATVAAVDVEGRLGELPRLRRRRARTRAAGTLVALVAVMGGVLLGLRGTGLLLDGPAPVDLGPALPAPTSAALMPVPGDRDLPAGVSRALQQALDTWVAGDNGVGVTAAVVSAGGSWQGAAGRDGAREPLAPRAAMALGHITTTFVAAEVMGLAGRGRIDLDAPIEAYVDLPFDTQGATVRQVLAMRSGFPVDPTDDLLVEAAKDLGRSWSSAEVFSLVDADGSRQGSLGDLYYNNVNAWVLGRLVERVTGTTWARALRRDLLDPAGLQRVWVQDAESPEPPLAVGRDSGGRTVDPAGPWLPSRSVATALGSAGSMAADAPTLARWAYLLYGGHVLDASLVSQMTAPSGGRDDWYGLGTVLGTGTSPISADGGSVVGHDGGTGSYTGMVVVWPHRDLAIAVLTPEKAQPPLVSTVTLDGLLEQLRAAVRSAAGR